MVIICPKMNVSDTVGVKMSSEYNHRSYRDTRTDECKLIYHDFMPVPQSP